MTETLPLLDKLTNCSAQSSILADEKLLCVHSITIVALFQLYTSHCEAPASPVGVSFKLLVFIIEVTPSVDQCLFVHLKILMYVKIL